MKSIEDMFNIYASRIGNPDCYIDIRRSLQNTLDNEARRYGLNKLRKVAHSLLAFCVVNESEICLPWTVAPGAPLVDDIGGRHSYVYKEFYKIAEKLDFSTVNATSRRIAYDDIISSFIIHNPKNETEFTVICDNYLSKSPGLREIKLLEQFTAHMPDHQILTKLENDDENKYLKIINGESVVIPYGKVRGLKLPTLASPGDILGVNRELNNYAFYANKHSLAQLEFSELCHRAVDAFHEGRRVGLDELCEEIINDRDK